MNELDQNNIDKGEDHSEAGNKVQNQGRNNNNYIEISDDEGPYNDPDNNDNDLNDNQQHNYDPSSDWDNEPDVDNSEDDNDCDPNDIGQGEEDVTIRSGNYNMYTQGNRTGSMAPAYQVLITE